jgi:hypothetical protein
LSNFRVVLAHRLFKGNGGMGEWVDEW